MNVGIAAGDNSIIRLSGLETYEWFETGISWRNWEDSGPLEVELITKDRRRLKSTVGLVPDSGEIYPIFLLKRDSEVFSAAWHLLSDLATNYADIQASGQSLRLFELNPKPINMDMAKSTYVTTSGDRITLVRNAVITDSELPFVSYIAQGPPYHYFFRGDLVENLREIGALEAFELIEVGRTEAKG